MPFIRKEIRHTLLKDLFIDIVIINCHPNILYQLCLKNIILNVTICSNILLIEIIERNFKVNEKLVLCIKYSFVIILNDYRLSLRRYENIT